jgi:Zn-dependent protease
VELCNNTAYVSLLLCFFNLLPIPPLDGSQVARSLLGISLETYHQIARYGFLILIVVINIPGVRQTLDLVTQKSFEIIAGWFGVQ